MIEVEGYKAFYGVLRVVPKSNNISPFELVGDFLYNPEFDSWYHNGYSYCAEICEIINDFGDKAGVINDAF